MLCFHRQIVVQTLCIRYIKTLLLRYSCMRFFISSFFISKELILSHDLYPKFVTNANRFRKVIRIEVHFVWSLYTWNPFFLSS
jgi:hypothetical protein